MIFRRPWTRQPQFGARANGGALAAGVRYIFNGAVPGPTLIGAPALTGNKFGLGPALNGSSQSVNTGQKFTYPQGTMLLLTAGAVGSVSSPCMASQSFDDAGNAVGLGWQGAAFEVNGNAAVLAGSTGPVTGDHCFVGTWGPAGVNGYLDGALIATNAYTGAPQAPAGDYNFELGCFRYSGGRVFFQQHTPALFAVWDRQLSPAEVAAITLTPWRLLPPRRRRLWVGPTAGGNVTLALTGTTATGSVGTLAPSISRALTGNAATAAVGTLTPATAFALSGATATGSPGTLTGAIAYALTGTQATASVGSLANAISYALTGTQATGSAGSVGAQGSVTIALSGVTATAALGTLAPAISSALTGIAGVGALGSVPNVVTYGLTANAATGAVGSLAASLSGDVTAALTGVNAAGAVGSLSASGGDASAWRATGPRSDRGTTPRRGANLSTGRRTP